ncbi:hypothetical protein EDB86DRAFT_3081180 [Lactarius hatsudake]|nr:hypothetical protein EDB86DRAFT_3081180 [Lactarius hatsudake]
MPVQLDQNDALPPPSSPLLSPPFSSLSSYPTSPALHVEKGTQEGWPTPFPCVARRPVCARKKRAHEGELPTRLPLLLPPIDRPARMQKGGAQGKGAQGRTRVMPPPPFPLLPHPHAVSSAREEREVPAPPFVRKGGVRRPAAASPLPPVPLCRGGGRTMACRPCLVCAEGGTQGHTAALSLSPPALPFPLSVPPRSRGRHKGTPPSPCHPRFLPAPLFARKERTRARRCPSSPRRPGPSLSPLSAPPRRAEGWRTRYALPIAPWSPCPRGKEVHEGTAPPPYSPVRATPFAQK